VLQPESEGSGSVEGYDGLELALEGANGGWVQGGAAGGSLVAWKGARRANLVGAVSSSASGAKERKSASAGGVTYITNGGDAKLPRRLATLAGKQLRARTHARGAARAAAALDRGAVIPIGSL